MVGSFGHARSITIIGSLLLSAQLCTGQLSQRSEFGFGAGAFNYTGDLVRTDNILN